MYYMHGLGHGIGLDVHDPEQAHFGGKINIGSAFTIEPGIYVRANLLSIIPETPKNRAMIAKIRSAVERHANIGVRIEDDYIVTPRGVEWISKAPREIGEVEALMAQRWAGVPSRNAELVRQYERTGS
jgi:Xaa-Pro aminopeptidase